MLENVCRGDGSTVLNGTVDSCHNLSGYFDSIYFYRDRVF